MTLTDHRSTAAPPSGRTGTPADGWPRAAKVALGAAVVTQVASAPGQTVGVSVFIDHLITEVFGLPEPREAGHFLEVRLTDGRIFEFAEPGIDFPGQHFAFLVDDATFDAVLVRLRRAGVTYWADPQQRR